MGCSLADAAVCQTLALNGTNKKAKIKMPPHRPRIERQRKTRRIKKQHGFLSPIQHHHLLLRLETRKCPDETSVQKESKRIKRLVRDLGMQQLDTPRMYYIKEPAYNSGLTGIVPIQTSHIAFHFWSSPDSHILQNKKSNCLLQLDIYTCGALPHNVVPILLNELEEYEPTNLDCTIFNRKYHLTKEFEIHWNIDMQPWKQWVASL
jgi:S-adenosylmethionine/arginine decarboxylase-like enzyme